MKKACITFILALLFLNIFSQEYELPKNYKLDTDADYTSYESDVLKSIDWLLKTPLNTQPGKRKDINTFVIAWISGSPTVTLEIKSEIVNFATGNPDLLVIFMCGWTKYAIEKKELVTNKTGSMKGIEAVIDFYVKNKASLKKDKNVEKYIKMKENGTLEEYISKNA